MTPDPSPKRPEVDNELKHVRTRLLQMLGPQHIKPDMSACEAVDYLAAHWWDLTDREAAIERFKMLANWQ